MNTSSDESPFGPVVFSYTRAQAIEDGVLVDVTSDAKGLFKIPVAVTEAVWHMIVPSEAVSKKLGCDRAGRLWDVLWMGSFGARLAGGSQEFLYEVILPQSARNPSEIVKLKMHLGGGDNGEPVITIMLPLES